MKIQAINCLKLNPYSKNTRTSFKNKLNWDVFENSNFSICKKTKVKNLQNEEVDAFITKEIIPDEFNEYNFEKYRIYVNGENKGSLTVEENIFGYMYISDLSTEKNSERNYKGLGTELIKCVVENSKMKGNDGSADVCAYNHAEAPFLFYFKNNFKVSNVADMEVESAKLYNAPLQYLIKHQKNVFNLIPKENDIFFMELDKKGADALINGKRLCNDRICDTVDNFMIGSEHYSAQFIESPYKNEYFLQVLDEDASNEPELCLILALEARKDNGKHFEITEILDNFPMSSDEISLHALGLLDDLAEKYI